MMQRIVIYDCTLRDGSQGEDVVFSAEDKLLVAQRLDEMRFDYIEGGFPGAAKKDAELFR
ncbi:MAG: citramalate synthase, partial [Planctomycetota bacterium]